MDGNRCGGMVYLDLVELRRLLMARFAWVVLALGFFAFGAAAEGAFDGEWRTSLGTVVLKQAGAGVTGTYGGGGQFTLRGAVGGKELRFEYQEGAASGEGRWTLADSGSSFG